jgi:hemerythrin superfamily protein
MDVVQLLVDQHRQLEGRFAAALKGLDVQPEQRRKRLAEIGDHLGVHLASEEEVFYPAVKQASTEDILLESLEEHLSLKRLLADLLALDPDDATYAAKLKVLAEQTEHHHREEEEHLFPKVRELLASDRREALGREVCERQLDMRRDPDETPREVIAQDTERAAPL